MKNTFTCLVLTVLTIFSLQSNAFASKAEVYPDRMEMTDCTLITFTGGNGSIELNNIDAPVVSIQIFDPSWSTVFMCFNDCDMPTQVIDGLDEGQYFAKVTLYNSSWQMVCNAESYVTVTAGGGNTGGCDQVTSSGAISGNESGCGSYDPAPITSSTAASGGSGTLEYIWLSSTTGAPTSENQAIAGATGASYDPGTITQTTYYVRCARRAGCAWEAVSESNTIVKTVDNSSNCNNAATCADRTVSNSPSCSTGAPRGFYLKSGSITGISNASTHFLLSNTSFIEYEDGTAHLVAMATNAGNNDIQFELVVIYSGRTFSTPTGSPKSSPCVNPSDDDFYYYTSSDGILIGKGALAGAEATMTRRGPAFQVGTGANLDELNIFGASGWLDINFIAQATNSSISILSETQGDVNIKLSGDSELCRPVVDPCAAQGGDADGDGICAADDCNDNDASVGTSQAAGTSCDDGDSNTTNDVIQSDGCTCAGTPSTGGGDCSDIMVSGTDNTLTISNLSAPVISIQIFNASWAQVFKCFADCDEPTTTITSLPAGDYFVKIAYYSSSYQLICDNEAYYTVTNGSGGNPCDALGGDADGDGICAANDCNDNDASVGASQAAGTSCDDGNSNTTNDVIQSDGCTCAGTPSTGGGDCADVTIDGSGNALTIGNLDAPIVSIQVFNASWSQEFKCFGDCTLPTTTISSLQAGTYFVKVAYYSSSYQLICNEEGYYDVTGGSTGPCAALGGDADGDGVCAANDCNDSDASVGAAQAAGTSCDDGNSNTTNDVIQSDGCTCAGTSVNDPCAALGGDADGDGICAANDCNDNNPLVGGQQAAGTACDDGNPNTNNDVVQADGCTCQGEASNDCGLIEITGGQDFISVTNLDAPITSVQIFDASWGQVYSCFGDCPAPVVGVPGLPQGRYFVKTILYSSNYQLICSNEVYIQVGDVPYYDCSQIEIEISDDRCNQGVGSIKVTAPNLPDGWIVGGWFGGDCATLPENQFLDESSNMFTISGLAAGCYRYDYTVYAPGYQAICSSWEQATINNSTQTPGASCDDGDSNTTNDVIQPDGCTCAGTSVPTNASCATRTILDTKIGCSATNTRSSFYALNLIDSGSASRRYAVQNGTFEEFEDGTAQLRATFVNMGDANMKFYASIDFSERTEFAVDGAPKLSSGCGINSAGSDWYYYLHTTGTLEGRGDLVGALLNVNRKGEPFQIGTGAGLKVADAFGASGWLMYSIVSQPNNGNLVILEDKAMDLNFELDGVEDACISGDCDFTWSGHQHLYKGGTVRKTIPLDGHFLNATAIDINEVVTTDHYSNRVNVNQTDERMKFVFRRNGVITGQSGYTNDLADNVEYAYEITDLGTVYLTNGADEVIFVHISDPTLGDNITNSANSLYVDGLCFSTHSSGLVGQSTVHNLDLRQKKTSTSLVWTNNTGAENLYFNIERSVNNQAFEVIGQVENLADNNDTRVYEFIDGMPANGDNTYRIKAVQKNNKEIVSNTETATFDDVFEHTLYPNPASELTMLALRNFAGLDISVQIIDGQGKVIRHFDVENYDASPIELPVFDLRESLYYIIINTNEGHTESLKLTINR